MEQKSAFIKSFPFTMLLSIVVTVILVFALDKYIGLSYLLGAMTSMMTMSMLYKSSNRLLDLPKAHATRVAAKNYAIRYMIYAVVLVAAGLSNNLHVLLVGFGLFTFKIVLMTILFLEKRRGGK